jgi:hypothetical protein
VLLWDALTLLSSTSKACNLLSLSFILVSIIFLRTCTCYWDILTRSIRISCIFPFIDIIWSFCPFNDCVYTSCESTTTRTLFSRSRIFPVRYSKFLSISNLVWTFIDYSFDFSCLYTSARVLSINDFCWDACSRRDCSNDPFSFTSSSHLLVNYASVFFKRCSSLLSSLTLITQILTDCSSVTNQPHVHWIAT